jgi:APA family basic amino acid/polyamine antiporter
MVTGVVFTMRKRRPDLHREYKAIGYPVLPAIFIVVGVLLLINTVYTSPKSTMIGLLFILSGMPVFYYFKKSRG